MYVLDPKLQDEQKIPKWNCQARQSRFFGFLDKHPLLVATFSHLTTGFVSRQRHVVFDDHFHTVYGNDEVNLITDAIRNLLWEND